VSRVLQLTIRTCEYCFLNTIDGTKKWSGYHLVEAKGEEFVQAVKDFWYARDQACAVTVLQEQARQDGFA
jgi:hypothetical protein